MTEPEHRTPTTDRAPVWPAAVCAATSAVFVALGGAFLVGVLALVSPELFRFPGEELEVPPSPARTTLLVTLYTAAGVCFAVALTSLALAFRRLP